MFYTLSMPCHGTIRACSRSGQLWTLVVSREPAPDYSLVFDNQTFSVFYRRITGGGTLSYDLLARGEEFVLGILRNLTINTTASPPDAAPPGRALRPS